MKQRIAGFTGTIPRVNPRLLPPQAAQRAVNTRLEAGDLKPFAKSALSHTLPTLAATIFRRLDDTWLSWAGDVNAANAPVSQDRTYYTGDGVPKVLYGAGTGTVLPLALPRPTVALVGTILDGDLDTATSEHVFYSYTFVTLLGEESQPANLSNEILCSALQVIGLTGFAVPPAGRGIDRYRIYRSQTDTLGATQLYIVDEVAVSSLLVPWPHDPTDKPVGSLIPSTFYDPPVDTLEGLVAGPNGMMAAFSGRDLYFCEPFIPHAWPEVYSLQMDYPIVGLASIGSAFVVMTSGTPYLLQGTSPATMVQTKLEQNLPCVAKKGIVDLGYTVIYPSTEGFVSVSNAGAQVVSNPLFTREQWAALKPATIVASQHIGHYIFSYLPDGADTRLTTLMDLTGAQPWLVTTTEPFTATFFQLGTGKLFFLIRKKIWEWDVLGQDPKTMIWRSRLFHLAGPINYGAFLVETDTYDGSGSMAVRIYADGVLVHTVTSRNTPERLPSGFLALRWECEYEGTIPVTSLNFASTITELASA